MLTTSSGSFVEQWSSSANDRVNITYSSVLNRGKWVWVAWTDRLAQPHTPARCRYLRTPLPRRYYLWKTSEQLAVMDGHQLVPLPLESPTACHCVTQHRLLHAINCSYNIVRGGRKKNSEMFKYFVNHLFKQSRTHVYFGEGLNKMPPPQQNIRIQHCLHWKSHFTYLSNDASSDMADVGIFL